MSIDEISGKVSAFWHRAKSALSATPSSQPAVPPEAPRPSGDSVSLPNKGHYFSGYAFPETPPESASPEESGGEPKVWAPLVISPGEPPTEST